MADAVPLLQVDHVTFGYGSRHVVRDVSFTAAAGEFVALVGPNGSGKTTLLRLLLNLLTPQTGDVRLAGREARRMRRAEIARCATIVPQDTVIDAAFAVRDIVAMGRTPYLGRFQPPGRSDDEAIDQAMAQTGTSSFERRPINQLSGGERQRVLLARAIAQQTPIVLLDEPTAHLDLAHQLEVLQLVAELARAGRCVVAAIHDLSLAARFCDRMIMLDRGAMVAAGTPEEVLTPARLRDHFKLNARIVRDLGTGVLIIHPVAAIADRPAALVSGAPA